MSLKFSCSPKILSLLFFLLCLLEIHAMGQQGDQVAQEQRLATTSVPRYARAFHLLSDLSTVASIVTGTLGAVEAYNENIHLEGQLTMASAILIGGAGVLRFGADYFDLGDIRSAIKINSPIWCGDNGDACCSNFCRATTYVLYIGSLVANIYSCFFSDDSELKVDLLGIGLASLAGFTNKDTYLYRSLFAIDRLNYINTVINNGNSKILDTNGNPRRPIINNAIELLARSGQQGRTPQMEQKSAEELQDFYDYLKWAGHIRNMYEHIRERHIQHAERGVYIRDYLKEIIGDENKIIETKFPFLNNSDQPTRDAREIVSNFIVNFLSTNDVDDAGRTNAINTVKALNNPNANENEFTAILDKFTQDRGGLVTSLINIINAELDVGGSATMNPIRRDPALPV